jgi:two-component system, LytTR family, sensor histidine kinase AlgZ
MVHPILADRRRLNLYLLAWNPIALLLALVLALGSGLSWLQSVVLAIPLALVYAFVCLSGWYISREVPRSPADLFRLLGAHTAAAGLSSALWLALGRGFSIGLESASPLFTGLVTGLLRQWPLLFVVGVLLYLLASAVQYTVLATDASRAAERRALELQVHAREAELRALRAQIDPHFLFNSLHSISALTTSNPQGARRMALLLGDFLRDSLRVGGRDRIPLGEELRLLRQFLDIEHVRFGDRLRVRWEVAEDTAACELPPLLLQPLVENAVTHGIAHLLDGGEVVVRAGRRGGRLYIGIENPCDPDRPRRGGAGVGLENVRRRLDTAFGSDAAARSAEQGGGFSVELVMPCGR